MIDTYEKYDNATCDLSAYAILFEGHYVAKIVLHHEEACTAFVHVFGAEMVSARTTGYGYDQPSHAIRSACGKLQDYTTPDGFRSLQMAEAFTEEARGREWGSVLEEAGFRVLNVV